LSSGSTIDYKLGGILLLSFYNVFNLGDSVDKYNNLKFVFMYSIGNEIIERAEPITDLGFLILY